MKEVMKMASTEIHEVVAVPPRRRELRTDTERFDDEYAEKIRRGEIR